MTKTETHMRYSREKLEASSAHHERFMRSWTTDADGNKVYWGLSLEETNFYKDYLYREFVIPPPPPLSLEEEDEMRSRFLSLYDKHHLALKKAFRK